MSRRPKPIPRLFLTDRAVKDLEAIELYSISMWGKKVAEKYLTDIQDAFDRLLEKPSLLRREPDFSPALRFYRVREHLLACDVRGDSIVLLTILHVSRDIPERLAELQPTLSNEVEILHEGFRDKQRKKSR